MPDNQLINCNCFVDGRGYAGDVEELTPPVLKLAMEEFRGGGMDMPDDIEVGMEKMEASFSLKNYSPELLKLFGFTPGQTVPLTFRGELRRRDGTVEGVVMRMRGKLRGLDSGSWKPGAMAMLKGMMTLTYFEQVVAGEQVHEIDVPNMVRRINGVDQLAASRAALGI